MNVDAIPQYLTLQQAAIWASAVLVVKLLQPLSRFEPSLTLAPKRALIGAGAVFLGGLAVGISLIPMVLIFALWALLHLLFDSWLERSELIPKEYLAELTLLRELALLVGAALVSKGVDAWQAPRWLGAANIGEGRIVVVCLFAWALIFLSREGTSIVRGLLNKGDVVPGKRNEGPIVDERSYQAGRLIGIIERLILFIIVIVGKYEALGFLLAAKGLIRSKELEKHDFAEYFILGTLVSTMEAVAVGILFAVFVLPLW